MGLFMRLNAQNCRDNLKRLETYKYAQKAKKKKEIRLIFNHVHAMIEFYSILFNLGQVKKRD